jgi:hypothetical protein
VFHPWPKSGSPPKSVVPSRLFVRDVSDQNQAVGEERLKINGVAGR